MTDKTAQSVFSGQDQQHNSEHQTPSIQAPRQAAQTTISSDGKTPESSYQQVDLKTNVTSQDQIKRLRGISPNYNVSLEELQTFLHDLLTSQFQAGRIVQTPFQGSPDGGYNLQLRLKRAASETPQEEQRYLFPTDIAFVLDDIVEFIEVKHASSTAIVLELFRIIVRGETLASLAAETIEGTTYYLESKLTLQANWSKMLRTAEALAVAIDALLTQETGQAERKLLPPLSEFGVPENDVKVLWHHIIQPLAQDFINAVDKNSYVFLSAKSQTISVLSENHYEVISFPPLLNQFSIVAWEFVQQNQSVLKDKWTTVLSFFDSHPYTFRQEQELSKTKTPAQSSVGKNFLEVWEFAFHQVAEAEKEDREKRLGSVQKNERDTNDDFDHIDFEETFIPVPSRTENKVRNHQAISLHAGFLYNHLLQDICQVYGLDPALVRLDPVLEWEIRNQIIINLYSLSPQELAQLRTNGRFILEARIFRQLMFQRAAFRSRLEAFFLSKLALTPNQRQALENIIESFEQRPQLQNIVAAQEIRVYQSAILNSQPNVIAGKQTPDQIIDQLTQLGVNINPQELKRLFLSVPPSMIYQLRFLNAQDLKDSLIQMFGIEIAEILETEGLATQLAQLASDFSAHTIISEQTQEVVARLEQLGFSRNLLEKSQLLVRVTSSPPIAKTAEQEETSSGQKPIETQGPLYQFRLNQDIVTRLPFMSTQELALVLGVDETRITDDLKTAVVAATRNTAILFGASFETKTIVAQLERLGIDSEIVQTKLTMMSPSFLPQLPHLSAEELGETLGITVTQENKQQIASLVVELGTRNSGASLPEITEPQQQAETVLTDSLRSVDGACQANLNYLESRAVLVQNITDAFLLRYDDPYALEDYLNKLTDKQLAQKFGLQPLSVEAAQQVRQSVIVYYHLRRASLVTTLPENMRASNLSINISGMPEVYDQSIADYERQIGMGTDDGVGFWSLTKRYDDKLGSDTVFQGIAGLPHKKIQGDISTSGISEEIDEDAIEIRRSAFRGFHEKLADRKNAFLHISQQPTEVVEYWQETYLVPEYVVQVPAFIPQASSQAMDSKASSVEQQPIVGPEQFTGSFAQAMQMFGAQQTAKNQDSPISDGRTAKKQKKKRGQTLREKFEQMAQRIAEEAVAKAANAVVPGGELLVKAGLKVAKIANKVIGKFVPEEIKKKIKESRRIMMLIGFLWWLFMILLPWLLLLFAILSFILAVKAIWNWFKDNIGNIISEFGAFLSDPLGWTYEKVVKPIGEGISSGVKAIGDFGGDVLGGARDLAGDAWRGVENLAEDIGDELGLNGDDNISKKGASGGGSRGFGGGLGTLTSGGTTAALASASLLSIITVSFLNPLPTIDSQSGTLSKYVTILKQAQPGNKFPEPTDITYQVAIDPKGSYKIKITNIEDSLTIRHNDDLNPTGNTSTPSSVNYTGDGSFQQAVESIEGEDPISEGIQFPEYTFNFSEDVDGYNHASIKNTITLTFDVYDQEDQLLERNQTARTAELVCFGECPSEEFGCWPATGQLQQTTESELGTHNSIYAIDVKNTIGTPVFSTFPGMACFYPDGTGLRPQSGYVYGNHISLTVEAEDSPIGVGFKLIYGHLHQFSDLYPGAAADCIRINAGQQLGQMGITGLHVLGPGYATENNSHLHYELRTYGGGAARSQVDAAGLRLEDLLPSENVNQWDFLRSCYD